MRKKMCLGLITVGATMALAQPPGGGERGGPRMMNPLFAALDKNSDGVLSADEIKGAAASLKTLDKDGDGQLAAAEVRPPMPAMRMDRRMNVDTNNGADELVTTLMAFDKNGDGQLSRDEVPERMQGMFDRGDKNKDGLLTRDEIQQLSSAQARPQQQEREGPRGGFNRPDPLFTALDLNADGIISADEMRQAPASLAKLDKNGDGQITMDEIRPTRGGPNPDDMIERMFSEFDTNHDGKLSKAEAPERMQPMFDRADTNHDGFLTKDEMKAAFTSQRGREQ